MKRIILLVFVIVCVSHISAVLLHRYEFNGNFDDSLAGPDLIPVNAHSSTFLDGTWSWTSYSAPGGGLMASTILPNPHTYSLRVVFSYLTFNSAWTKIVSFSGYNNVNHYFSSDYGLYFNHGNLYLYPMINNNSIFFSPNTMYDLLITRSASNLLQVYLNPLGQPRQLVFQYADNLNDFVPDDSGIYSCFGLFYDDTTTTGEWTNGGSVSLIEVYDSPLTFDNVQNPTLTESGDDLILTWDSFTGATSYNVYYTQDPAYGNWMLLSNTVNTSLVISPDIAKRFFYVKAVY